MARKIDFTTWAPAIAIALIVIGAIAAEYWLIPSDESPSPLASAPREAAREPISPSPAQADLNPGTWPLYHGGPNLAGKTDVSVPEKPALLWQYYADSSVFQVPVSDERGIYVATRSGTVVALDFQGRERWSRVLGNAPANRIEAPLACFRTTVVVGTRDGKIHAIDVEDGKDRWTYEVGGTLLGTTNFHAPAEEGEPVRVFAVKQDDGTAHCIDFSTGEVLWRSVATDRCDGSAAVGDGFLVYGNCTATLHVFAVADGALLRSIELGADCQVAGGPALVGGEIYSGSRCHRVVRADVRTGQIVWSNSDSENEVFTTPAVAGGSVVFGSEDGCVYALDRQSGALRWRFETGGTPRSPIIAADKVIVSSDGVLRILQLDTGRELWNYEVSDGITAPAIVNGMVVVGSEDGTVAAFGTKDT